VGLGAELDPESVVELPVELPVVHQETLPRRWTVSDGELLLTGTAVAFGKNNPRCP
jgi:hypothetical protein